MVGHRKVIVDGLRDAHELLLLLMGFSIISKHLYGVHRIVSSVVKEILDVLLVENVEDLLVKFLITFDWRQFVAACAEE